jgi:hypothetical protein
MDDYALESRDGDFVVWNRTTDFAIAYRQSDVSFRVGRRNPCHHELLPSFEQRNRIWSVPSHPRASFAIRAKDGASTMGAQRRTGANGGVRPRAVGFR